jgi:hypothetical protein
VRFTCDGSNAAFTATAVAVGSVAMAFWKRSTSLALTADGPGDTSDALDAAASPKPSIIVTMMLLPF